VAAAAACLAIGLGLWANSLSNSLDRERSANSVVDRLLAKNATAKPLAGANGSLIVARDGEAALVVCGLADAPSSKTYQAWVITGDSPEPAGLLRGGSGCNPLPLTRSVTEKATVAVTLERAGGATSPTLPILFKAAAT
jgi:anti-sigma-K factor RskA